MKRSYFNNDSDTSKNAKSIQEVYEDVNKIKLVGSDKVKYNFKSIISPISAIRSLITLSAAKRKYDKYVKEDKPVDTANERYKYVDKLIKSILNYKRVKFHEFGFDHVPKTPVLYIANHKSNIDALLLLRVTYQHYELPFVRVVAKKELDDSKKRSYAFKLIDTIFVDRKDIRNLNQVINELVDASKNDSSLLIFPEGTRVEGDQLQEFHSALLEVAVQTGIPVVPVCIFGTDGFLTSDKNKKPRYKINEIVVDALEPIKYSEYMHWGRKHLAEVLKERIQNRYDLWKKHYEYMESNEFKKLEKKNPLKANKELNSKEKEHIKAKMDN